MLIVTSTAQATTHGVYGIERNPPAVIRPIGTATAAMVDQFPWGPTDAVYTVLDPSDFALKFAPPGMSRAGAGYMAVAGKAYPLLKLVRILGSAAVAASATINKTGPTALIVVTLKYKGTSGNSVVCTTSAATDGDANHFNLTVSVTGATGTTTDKFENMNVSGVGTDVIPTDFTNTYLVGSITKSSSGLPIIGSTTCTSGADGTVDSAAYVGTIGTGDKGVALLEGDKSPDFVFTGDPGNTLRAAVNAGLVAHADYMTDRMAFINGNSGLSLAAVQTDVASYRSLRACYIDVWAYQRDDVDGTQRLTPPAPFAVSVAANLPPSTSFSAKGQEAQQFLRSIVSLEARRGPGGAYTNEQAGICTLQQEEEGGFTFECAVVTAAPTNPTKRKYKRTRMAHYIVKSVAQALRPYVDLPNVPFNQQDEVNAVDEFLGQLKRNAVTNPNGLAHIVDYSIPDLKTYNSAADLAQDIFTIPANIKISSDQSKIFFSMQIGESVDPTLTL